MNKLNINLDKYARFITQFVALNISDQPITLSAPEAIKTKEQFDYGRYSAFLLGFSPLYKTHLASGNLINSFTLFGPKRNEVKNVALLAWVFDSRALHGQGVSFFHAFLDGLWNETQENSALDKAHWHHYTIKTELNPFGDNANRLDMVLKAKDAVIYIEVKIDHDEGDNQIARYLAKLVQEQAKHKALILLKANKEQRDDGVISASWSDVAACLKPSSLIAEFPKIFFEQQAKHFTGFLRRKHSKNKH